MNRLSVSRLSDSSLKRILGAVVTRDCRTTASLLVLIAEFDDRKLYREDGYPSMYAYCVGELRMSEDVAYKRIRAARAARRFPVIFAAVADGRLNLSGVCLLAAHLTEDTAAELLAAAEGKTGDEIELILAARFPRPDVPFRLEALGMPEATPEFRQLAARPVATIAVPSDGPSPGLLAPCEIPAQAHMESAAAVQPGHAVAPPEQTPAQHAMTQVGERMRLKPLAPGRFMLQGTIGQTTHDKLRHAQELLSHQIPSGDIVQVLDRALDELIHKREKQKFATTSNPRAPQGQSSDPRHIPAHVKRAVRQRDRGQCTYVSARGQRCGSRRFLEFDHIEPVARGGQATVSGLRLRCRAHNQLEADQVFGAEFMNGKREAARRAAGATPSPMGARSRATLPSP